MDEKCENCWQEQLDRIDRLMEIMRADDQTSLLGGALRFYDIVVFSLQSIWHLKDWILNDPEFHPKDSSKLKSDIHGEQSLRICADLANGTKHLKLKGSKVGAFISNSQGIDLDPSRGRHQTYYYVICSDSSDPYHGMEIRDLLSAARQGWDRIIQTHYLTKTFSTEGERDRRH